MYECLVVVAVAWLLVLDPTVQPGDVNEGDDCDGCRCVFGIAAHVAPLMLHLVQCVSYLVVTCL